MILIAWQSQVDVHHSYTSRLAASVWIKLPLSATNGYRLVLRLWAFNRKMLIADKALPSTSQLKQVMPVHRSESFSCETAHVGTLTKALTCTQLFFLLSCIETQSSSSILRIDKAWFIQGGLLLLCFVRLLWLELFPWQSLCFRSLGCELTIFKHRITLPSASPSTCLPWHTSQVLPTKNWKNLEDELQCWTYQLIDTFHPKRMKQQPHICPESRVSWTCQRNYHV